jgi:lipoprotein
MKKNAIGFVVLSVMLFGCASVPNRNVVGNEQISFETSEKGELVICNKSGLDLVILAGNTGISSEDKVLGGILADSTRVFDCSEVPKFNEGTFFLNAVKLEDYKTRKIHFGDVVFSSLVLPDYSKITISKHTGSNEFFVVSNYTPQYVVQLRIDSPEGEVLTSIMPLSTNARVYFVPSNIGRSRRIFYSYITFDGKIYSSRDYSFAVEPTYGEYTLHIIEEPKKLE